MAALRWNDWIQTANCVRLITRQWKFSWNCSTPWILDFRCAGAHMFRLYRG